MTRSSSGRIFVAAVVVVGILTAQVTSAAPQPLNGINLSPALKTVVLGSGQDSATFYTTISNDTATAVTVTLTARNFTSSPGDGSLQLSDSGPRAHQLADSLRFEADSFRLAPHASKVEQVTIANANQLAPGGHYGAVMYKVSSPSAKTSSSATVGLNQVLSTLVFVSTAGMGTQDLTLHLPPFKIAFWHLPTRLIYSLTDTGNTQTVARGLVNISGPGHKQIAKGVINPSSSLILPGSTRLFSTPLTPVSHSFWPGTYHTTVYYRADSAGRFKSQTSSFIYFNAKGVLIIVVLILGAMMLIYQKKRRRNITVPVDE